MAYNIDWGDSIELTISGGTWEYELPMDAQAGWYFSEYNPDSKSQTFRFYEDQLDGYDIFFKFTSVSNGDPNDFIVFDFKEIIKGETHIWSKYVKVDN